MVLENFNWIKAKEQKSGLKKERLDRLVFSSVDNKNVGFIKLKSVAK
jgi:hypothetical protein